MKHLYKFSLLLLAFLLPATALAHDFEVDGIYYNINGNEASVSKSPNYNYSGSVTIPTTVTYSGVTYSVTAIGDYAFMDCYGLTSITIPNSVISIGYMAFDSCYRLTSITIPNSVTTIGNSVFSGCSGLTSIVVASGNPTYDSRNDCNAIIETASNTLIYGCMNTIIPNSVISIGEGAFYHITSLTSIDIPNSVTAIGDIAFCNCTSLTSIDIPNSVTTIGRDAFYGTTWYNNQPDGLVYAGLVAYKYKGTMPSGTSIILRNGTLGIAGFAFLDCSNLTNINIPNSVTTISDHAFLRCNGLTSIDIPNSVTTIGESVFSGCSRLTSVTIGNSVTTIDFGAFSGCTSLTSITIPNSVTEIGVNAFSGCSRLTSIDIPNSVTSIGYGAFYKCSGLTSVNIGNSVTSIGDYAFYGCSSLIEIYSFALVPATVSSSTFYGCYGVTLYVPKQAVNAYKAAKYWYFTKIFGIILPGYTFEVNGIYYRVMSDDAASVIANEDVESYYSGDVVIPDSVTYEGMSFVVTGIENNAFDGCFELTSVVIPNSVTDIGEQAFQGCTGLTSVTIGSGVTAIGAKAFNYCNVLASVKCIGTVPPMMESTDCFTNAAYNRATLLVPRNYEATYAAADYWYKFAHIEGWGSAGRGDIDGDGEVSIRDVTRMIDAILTGDNEGVYFESADLNSNGRLDIGDVTSIIDMLLNGE